MRKLLLWLMAFKRAWRICDPISSDAVHTELRRVDSSTEGMLMPAMTVIRAITTRSSNMVKPRVERMPALEQEADQRLERGVKRYGFNNLAGGRKWKPR